MWKRGSTSLQVGGDVGRLNVFGINEIGPLRCCGGLCLSRSIGDTDVGQFIVPIPHGRQGKFSDTGGRLVLASDGIWDALSSDMAAQSCRGLPAELAAILLVKASNSNSGLLRCVVCQADQSPSDGLYVNLGTVFSPVSKPWEGPFLCAKYWKKKDAMEGKRRSRPTLTA